MKRAETFDAIIVETTGLADPAPVAQTFFVDQEVAERTRLDAIVTVADAVHLGAQLGEHHEAEEQIAFADIVLLNKTDLVDPDGLGRVEERIRRINPYARIIRTERCGAELDEVIGLAAFSLERVLAVEPDFLTSDHDHEHDDAVKSLSLVADAPLDFDKFQSWFGQLLQTRGRDILRSKGILDFSEKDDRYVFQGVHMLMDGAPMGGGRRARDALASSSSAATSTRWVSRRGSPRAGRHEGGGRGRGGRRGENRRGEDIAETRFERAGLALDTGAPVTAAAPVGGGVVAGFGDGAIRFFRPDEPPVIVEAHRGAVLCLAAEEGTDAVLTGGDDGRFLRVRPDGTVEEIASFGSRWVDCVAAGPGVHALLVGPRRTAVTHGRRRREALRAPEHGRRPRLRREGAPPGRRALRWGHGLETRRAPLETREARLQGLARNGRLQPGREVSRDVDAGERAARLASARQG